MTDIRKLLSKMTLEEKIGQLVQLGTNVFLESQDQVTGPLYKLGLTQDDLNRTGNVIGCWKMLEIQKKHLENDPNKIPLLFMLDVVHGFRTVYPIPLALGCSFDRELVWDCSRMAAKEAASAGVHVTFAPMVDYVRDARWGRVLETFGEDALMNGILGAVQVKAFQGDDLSDNDNVAVCVKHFAAYGGAEAGRDYNSVDLSEHTLREHYLPAYKACIDAGASMVMPAFNTLNGVPCTANPWLMKKILREEWNFDGVVISDYGAVGELVKHGVAKDKRDAARLAIDNGCDIDMCSGSYVHHLKELVEDGSVTEKQLDKAVLRVLKLKEKLGLFKDPYRGVYESKESETILTPENYATVRKAAEECAVLLKNDGVLPLSDTVKKVAVIGPFSDSKGLLGAWSGVGRIEETTSISEGIVRLLPDCSVTVVQGCSDKLFDENREEFEKAVSAAKNADAVIICLGEHSDYSGESCSRTDLTLPGVQEELALEVLKANKNAVIVTVSGRPLVLTKLEKAAPAILHMWFPGTEGGNACANLLFGKANPCGKLSISFPRAVGQCPIYYNHMNTGRPKPADLDDDQFRYFSSNYLDCGNLPLYSFGHGLSYSDFVYESLELSNSEMTSDDEIKVTVTIHNNSTVPGKETVLLFMHDVVASVSRPVHQMIDFKKVFFEAGERKTIEFTINEKMLRFWNMDNEYVSESGEFEISTGCADHLILTKSFVLK